MRIVLAVTLVFAGAATAEAQPRLELSRPFAGPSARLGDPDLVVPPPPPPARDRSGKHWGHALATAGGALALGSYLPVVIVGLTWERGFIQNEGWSAVPIAGPLVLMADNPHLRDDVVFPMGALLQALGFAALFVGLAITGTWSEGVGAGGAELRVGPTSLFASR